MYLRKVVVDFGILVSVGRVLALLCYKAFSYFPLTHTHIVVYS